METEGGVPQKNFSTRAGVSLTRPERDFLSALSDPLSSAKFLHKQGALVGLRADDVDYIHEWVVNHGAHFIVCEAAELDTAQGARIFRNPLVRRVINAAAELGLCLPTTAVKDEIEDYWTQRMRAPYLPEAVRDNAADKLAKLKGYYPDARSAATGGNNIQINLVNPYGVQPSIRQEEEVEVCEVG